MLTARLLKKQFVARSMIGFYDGPYCWHHFILTKCSSVARDLPHPQECRWPDRWAEAHPIVFSVLYGLYNHRQESNRDIQIERSFTTNDDAEVITRRLDKWSLKYGFVCTSNVTGSWEFRRGSHFVAAFTFDVRKIPTVVSVTLKGGQPTSVQCSLHVRSWLRIATPGDYKRVEEQADLLVSYLKGVI